MVITRYSQTNPCRSPGDGYSAKMPAIDIQVERDPRVMLLWCFLIDKMSHLGIIMIDVF